MQLRSVDSALQPAGQPTDLATVEGSSFDFAALLGVPEAVSQSYPQGDFRLSAAADTPAIATDGPSQSAALPESSLIRTTQPEGSQEIALPTPMGERGSNQISTGPSAIRPHQNKDLVDIFEGASPPPTPAPPAPELSSGPQTGDLKLIPERSTVNGSDGLTDDLLRPDATVSLNSASATLRTETLQRVQPQAGFDLAKSATAPPSNTNAINAPPPSILRAYEVSRTPPISLEPRPMAQEAGIVIKAPSTAIQFEAAPSALTSQVRKQLTEISTTMLDAHGEEPRIAGVMSAPGLVERVVQTPLSAPIAASGTDPTLAQIRGQIANISLGQGGTSAELRLDPPELGRVRISLEIIDNHVTAHLAPDRPEVTDLLRRHADLLLRDLLSSGFDGAQMSFAEGKDRNTQTHIPVDFHKTDPEQAVIALALSSDRLDLRL